MLDYCILTFPWLVPLILSIVSSKQATNSTKTESVQNRPVCSNLYTSYTSGISKNLKHYVGVGKKHIYQQQKESTQKLFLNKNEKSSRERKVSVFFQQDQTTITKTNHEGFAWLKHKKKHKKHNHNRIMKVWKQQNRKKKYKFIALPPNKRYCLTPLARH